MILRFAGTGYPGLVEKKSELKISKIHSGPEMILPDSTADL